MESGDVDLSTVLENELRNEEPYALLKKTLDEQESSEGRRWTLFLDIDGTVYKEGINNSALYEQIKEGHWGLTYVTATDIKRMVALIQEGKIARPLAAGTNLGTRRFYLKEKSFEKSSDQITEADFEEDRNYLAKVEASGFNKTKLFNDLTSTLFQRINADPKFSKFKFMLLPPGDTTDPATYAYEWIPRDPYKFDLYVTVAKDANAQEIQEYQTYIKGFFTDYDILMYQDQTLENGDTKWNFHILPKNAWGKDNFVRDLASEINTKGLIAGDSGNDIVQLLADYPGEAKDFIRAYIS